MIDWNLSFTQCLLRKALAPCDPEWERENGCIEQTFYQKQITAA